MYVEHPCLARIRVLEIGVYVCVLLSVEQLYSAGAIANKSAVLSSEVDKMARENVLEDLFH